MIGTAYWGAMLVIAVSVLGSLSCASEAGPPSPAPNPFAAVSPFHDGVTFAPGVTPALPPSIAPADSPTVLEPITSSVAPCTRQCACTTSQKAAKPATTVAVVTPSTNAATPSPTVLSPNGPAVHLPPPAPASLSERWHDTAYPGWQVYGRIDPGDGQIVTTDPPQWRRSPATSSGGRYCTPTGCYRF